MAETKEKPEKKIEKLKGKQKQTIRHRIKSITVYDMMTRDVVVIDSQNSLETLLTVIKDRGISGVPVMEHDELIGVVGESDLKNFANVDDFSNLSDEMLEKMKITKVKDVMKEPVTITDDSTIETAAKKMKKHSVDRLIVIGKNKKMTGLISKTDLVKGASKAIVKKRMETAIDEVLDILERRGSITLDEISQGFHTDKTVVEEWAKILEEHKLVVINYPVIGKPFLSLTKSSQ